MRLMIFLLLFVSLACFGWAEEPLTNATIVRLSNAGIDDDIIKQLVRTQPGQYDIAPNELLSMKNAGVGDAVTREIVDHSGATVSVTTRPIPTVAIPASRSRSYQAMATSQNVPTTTERQPDNSRSGSATLGLEDATPVRLRVTTAVSSANAKLGDTVSLQVAKAVRIGTVVVIPRGAKATGTIAVVKHKADLGRSGQLQLTVDSITLPDATEIPLRARADNNVNGSEVDSIVFGGRTKWLTAPLLIIQGKDAIIPHGAQVTGYVDGDFSFTNAQTHTSETQSTIRGVSPRNN